MVKLGILGGGQLGKMLLQSSSSFNVESFVLEPNSNGPAAHLCHHFTQGDFNNYNDVLKFGQQVDVLTIEIENVNVKALKQLQTEGKTVCPSPAIIEMIQDKGLQKQFYESVNLPSSSYQLYTNKAEVLAAISQGTIEFPFIQKLRKEGYDGKGVVVISNESATDKIFDAPSVIEEKISIDKELAVIVARNKNKEIACFPVVEMEFNPTANLVEYLFAPSNIDKNIAEQANDIAVKLAEGLELEGILAVELFLTTDGELLVNECAPRPHNSGHHTIEANITSQYEQHLRAILNLPLGSTKMLSPAVMVNLLGEANYSGKAVYQGLEEVLKI